ncbi:hypothetical protein BEWA_026560 [Theileria equi strain WA]|uniref:Uncharacterized protein n=1 Tax=Theileria equi strain WA TaxID=1537102 RepID=L0AW29_THEEQ|nr:hypothetical protein BEWA_026560 [Theileria equi strain WA]AFZ79807.1 hypothetical protein BEWA_026560 [Theileria equi strain WA]|eukprot:XP_004829473.1 hypothetical protein BEWA_026560 [Theileria equi strain WA]
MFAKWFNQDKGDRMKQLSLFLAGFALLQPLRIGLTAAKFAAKRFALPDKSLDLFITKIHNSMHLANLTGVLTINIYLWTLGAHTSQCFRGKLSIFTNLLSTLMNFVLFFVYASGGDRGHVTAYYWNLVLSAYAYGLNQAMAVTVVVKDVAFFTAAIPLAGVQVSIFHYLFLKATEKIPGFDVNFWLVIWQIIISITLSALSSVLWTSSFLDTGDEVFVYEYDDHEPLVRAIIRAWSPLLMSALGMGIVFGFYPAIAPYKLAPPDTAHRIDLVILIVSAMPMLINCVMCAIGLGPNRRWTGKSKYWHAVWIVAIPYLTCPVLFLVAMHKPQSAIGYAILNNSYFCGFLCVTIVTGYGIFKSVGFSAVGLQGGYKNGRVSTFNSLVSFIMLVSCSFIGGGYLRAYKSFEDDRDNWPTKGFGFWKSFAFWWSHALTRGIKSVASTFTLDIRAEMEQVNVVLLVNHIEPTTSELSPASNPVEDTLVSTDDLLLPAK